MDRPNRLGSAFRSFWHTMTSYDRRKFAHCTPDCICCFSPRLTCGKQQTLPSTLPTELASMFLSHRADTPLSHLLPRLLQNPVQISILLIWRMVDDIQLLRSPAPPTQPLLSRNSTAKTLALIPLTLQA